MFTARLAANVDVNEKSVSTRKGAIIKYDYLILADPFESDTSSIKGYNEDTRSVETSQKALSLREDLKKIISGDIVIYHCTNSSFTSTFAASLAVNIKSYISGKETADKLNVKFISSENSVVTDRITEDLIASTLEKNGIHFNQFFHLIFIRLFFIINHFFHLTETPGHKCQRMPDTHKVL